MNSTDMHDPTQPHDHVFGQDQRRPGEARTLAVFALTVITMVVEIAAGIWTGSMALLADGLHMGSHALALGIVAIAYWYARRHAANPAFSFGTGKVNALGGYTGALLLGVFGFAMAWESIDRMLNPVTIAFDYAIGVAVIGLVVNGLSVLILGHDEHSHHSHSHTHAHQTHNHSQHQQRDHDHDEDDHNLRSAYFHVLADALTSLLAIVALLAGKYADLFWMDPLMGVIGAILVTRWSITLLADTSATLLDKQAPQYLEHRVRNALEVGDNDQVTDLHLWSVGPGLLAAEIVVVTDSEATANDFRARLPDHLGLVHSTIEIHRQ